MNLLFDAESQARLIYLAVFLGLFLFSLGVSQLVRQRSARRELVAKIRGGGIVLDSSAEDEGDPAEKKADSPLIALFGKIGKHTSALKSEDYSNSRLKFLRAGIRHENAFGVHWGVKIILTFLFPSIVLVARALVLNTMNYQITIAVTVLGALLGFYLPDIWLSLKTEKRRRRSCIRCPTHLTCW